MSAKSLSRTTKEVIRLGRKKARLRGGRGSPKGHYYENEWKAVARTSLGQYRQSTGGGGTKEHLIGARSGPRKTVILWEEGMTGSQTIRRMEAKNYVVYRTGRRGRKVNLGTGENVQEKTERRVISSHIVRSKKSRLG